MKPAPTAQNAPATLHAWLALSLTPGLGSAGCKRLVEFFGSPEAALAATPKELAKVGGLKKQALEQLRLQPGREAAEREIERAAALGVHLVHCQDPAYPLSLRSIHNPPVILYVRGELAVLSGPPAIAMVGSRAATSYGRQIAGSLARSLARAGVTVVSGLALGIDAAAHAGALAGGGKSIGVLGCGLDIVYPEANRSLFAALPNAGALVSEYPFGTKPDSFRFPARNRIISGLTLGLVVVEASRNSGSLITAKHALDQGREVFAVPGRVDSIKSVGPHLLIKEGAKLVAQVEDILEEFSHLFPAGRPVDQAEGMEEVSLTNEEETLMQGLDAYPKSIDEIIQASGFSANLVSELLLHMELKGVVEALPGKHYRRSTLQ